MILWFIKNLSFYLTQERTFGSRTQVTVFNDKDWGYNDIGVLDEVFKSYLAFRKAISEDQVRDLLIRFSVIHFLSILYKME